MTDSSNTPSTNSVSLQLLARLSQELLTPLTAITGMASVLSQGIYGSLTVKQKEYVDILNERSRYLRSLIEEIIALAKLAESDRQLDRKAADVENLCLQAIASIQPEASRRELKVSLDRGLTNPTNPESSGSRLLLLDKNFFQQMLQNLLSSVIYAADAGSTVKLHLSRKEGELVLALWIYHPILGESLPHSDLYTSKLSTPEPGEPQVGNLTPLALGIRKVNLVSSELAALIFQGMPPELNLPDANKSSDLLRLLLACQLLELQGGTLSIQGSPDLGYRYLLSFPVG